jgi:hypothetical protein
MGLETLLIAGTIGLGTAGMVSSYQSAAKQSKALKAQAALEASERSKATTALAAEQKVSFLNSGIALTGEDNTTPTSVLSSTYIKGKEDIGRIKENYNTKIDNVWSAERSSFLTSLGTMALGLATAGVLSGLGGAAQGGSLLSQSGSVGAIEGLTPAVGQTGMAGFDWVAPVAAAA